MHGRGSLAMLNGDRYEGEWMNDSKEGYGVHGYSDNSKYEGNWKDDKQHGKGTLVTSDGSTYQGMWKDGKKHGQVSADVTYFTHSSSAASFPLDAVSFLCFRVAIMLVNMAVSFLTT
eukprot:SAG11_NODE_88_length_17244_cov_17.187460_6_plen_117_part_00